MMNLFKHLLIIMYCCMIQDFSVMTFTFLQKEKDKKKKSKVKKIFHPCDTRNTLHKTDTFKMLFRNIALSSGETSEIESALVHSERGRKSGKYVLCFDVCRKSDWPLATTSLGISALSYSVKNDKE